MDIFKNLRLILLLTSMATISACNNNKKPETMQEESNTSIFPQGNKITNGYFSGDAYLLLLQEKDRNNDFALGNVTFEPGARTNWHTHPKGQVLIVTEGKGWYQEKGKPAQVITKGDVINIPEDVEHWHGASADSRMIHIAITNYQGDQNVTWMQPVTDAEYDQVNKNHK